MQRAETREAHARAIQRVIVDMREHLDEQISLRHMAGTAYMSRYHFVRTFRRVTGVAPRQYLRALRLQAAKSLLVDTPSSVTDVCLDVGYDSLGTFVRCFTDLFGVSPRRLRMLGAQQPPEFLAADVEPHIEGGGRVNVSGRIETPVGFNGVILVGLFATAIPQGKPSACTMLRQADEYHLGGVSDGTYNLFALGVPATASTRELIACQSVLRAGGLAVAVRNGETVRSCDLVLREPSASDPPLLLTIPGLLAMSARDKSHARAPNLQALPDAS